jgi:hypothetical protein
MTLFEISTFSNEIGATKKGGRSTPSTPWRRAWCQPHPLSGLSCIAASTSSENKKNAPLYFSTPDFK